jgi:Ecdysteroid kinase-like family
LKGALDIEEITADWLSATLGYKVRAVIREKVGTGQTGASYRLTLEADEGPRTLLAKVAAGDLEARARVAGGYAAEVGFYTDLVDTLDVRTPRCWYAAISADHLHFTLLLEDLAPRQPGVQAKGCTLQRASESIRNLAGLHAPRWNDPSLYDLDFLIVTRGQERVDFLANITRAAAAEFVERYREELGPADVATVLAAAAAIGPWLMLPAAHFSVLHGDYRLDNLMFGDDPGDVVALDWQTASVGPPGRDLAYFLGTCLQVEQRREAERELVEHYHRELVSRGVSNYDLEACFCDYRRGQLQATMITTIGCIYATGTCSSDSDAMFLAMARRSCAAIRDLGTLDFL